MIKATELQRRTALVLVLDIRTEQQTQASAAESKRECTINARYGRI
jgi:hypothetical protein